MTTFKIFDNVKWIETKKKAIQFNNKMFGCNALTIVNTVKILKFGTPKTLAIIVLKIEKFDVTLN